MHTRRITIQEVGRTMKDKITCSVVGARGYAGIETARLLMKHPNAILSNCFATGPFQLRDFIGSPKQIKFRVCTKVS
ncbi:MAG: hypothetical protein EOP06_15765 [Proteobacteria bacterium]|nr:MAG: hypothetical protein EOP06_15765 [Pseudomonadota bacterium]